MTRGRHAVMSYTAAGDDRLLLVVSSPTSVGDLHLTDRSGALTRVAGLNDELFGGIPADRAGGVLVHEF
jgi:hypothetical protein